MNIKEYIWHEGLSMSTFARYFLENTKDKTNKALYNALSKAQEESLLFDLTRRQVEDIFEAIEDDEGHCYPAQNVLSALDMLDDVSGALDLGENTILEVLLDNFINKTLELLRNDFDKIECQATTFYRKGENGVYTDIVDYLKDMIDYEPNLNGLEDLFNEYLCY